MLSWPSLQTAYMRQCMFEWHHMKAWQQCLLYGTLKHSEAHLLLSWDLAQEVHQHQSDVSGHMPWVCSSTQVHGLYVPFAAADSLQEHDSKQCCCSLTDCCPTDTAGSCKFGTMCCTKAASGYPAVLWKGCDTYCLLSDVISSDATRICMPPSNLHRI